MTTYRRTAAAAATLALAGAGLLGLTACGRAGAPAHAGAEPAAAGAAAEVAAAEVAADFGGLGLEEAALAQLGFEPVELAAEPAASPSAQAGDRERRGDRRGKRPLRRELLRGRVLHAEAVVQTKEGTRTLLSQRGAITAIDGTTVTVKSADGFTLTWTFGEKLRVVERRRTVQPSALEVGAEIGVAGAKEGTSATAGLIVRRVGK